MLLTGGSSLFPGMEQRLAKELTALAPGPRTLRVEAPRVRHAAWAGGAVLHGRGPRPPAVSFESLCVLRSEYVKTGPRIVHRKCFN